MRGYGDILTLQFGTIKDNLKKTGVLGLPMSLRLFLFLVVLVVTMLIGILSILLVSGTFTAGLTQSEKLVRNDLTYLSKDKREFGLALPAYSRFFKISFI